MRPAAMIVANVFILEINLNKKIVNVIRSCKVLVR